MTTEPNTTSIAERLREIYAAGELTGSSDHAAVRAAADEIDRLTSELDAFRASSDIRGAEIERLTARVAELEQDAKRYRWLANETLACDYGDNDDQQNRIGWVLYGWRNKAGSSRIYGASIDAAIDAALAKDGA